VPTLQYRELVVDARVT